MQHLLPQLATYLGHLHIAATQRYLTMTPELLRAHGLVGRKGGVKVLARGDISKKLTIRAHKFSGKAAEKIAAAGGTAEVLA